MFEFDYGFCMECASVLPPFGLNDFVQCYGCKKTFKLTDFGKMKSDYHINFNSVENIDLAQKNNDEEQSTGPVVERLCRKCGHNLMSYAAMQLRSADEGQTVFFTCLNCKYHEWMQRKDLQEATASEPLSEEEEYQMQQTWLLDDDKCTFIILDKGRMDATNDEIGAMIGDVNLYLSVQNGVKVGECGIMIAENNARGQGKGMEALLFMLRFGCETLKIGTFEAKINLANTTSLSLFEKIGFKIVNKSDVFMEATLAVDVTTDWKRWLDQETAEFSITKYCS